MSAEDSIGSQWLHPGQYHAMVELPADPDVILVIVHNRSRFMAIPVHKSEIMLRDSAELAIERAERDLQTDRTLYRGAPGERI